MTISHYKTSLDPARDEGWTNRQLASFHERQRRVLSERFGGRVKSWLPSTAALIPLAAVGLAFVMVGAVAVHVRLKEAPVPSVPLTVLLVLSVVRGYLAVRAHDLPRTDAPEGAGNE